MLKARSCAHLLSAFARKLRSFFFLAKRLGTRANLLSEGIANLRFAQELVRRSFAIPSDWKSAFPFRRKAECFCADTLRADNS